MIGIWTKREFGVLNALLVLQLIGTSLVISSGNSSLLGLILVAIGALGQIAVALRFRARRKRAGTWRSKRGVSH